MEQMERKSFLALSCHHVCKAPDDVGKDLSVKQFIRQRSQHGRQHLICQSQHRKAITSSCATPPVFPFAT